uniref:FGGY-family carbohydrate kinase n=1 Tax=Clostridium sp. NkU-1 TaxID=1095009 RepID=UPI000AC14223
MPGIDYLVTLEGYVHWKLTGERVLGIGDCSGMFPVDSGTKDFHKRMVEQFDELVAPRQFPWKLRDIMPRVLTAGERAGILTEEGARLLDASGNLRPGIPLCPPEGDAGTGMTATNSVARRTGNVSAGTSVFAMVVLEKELSRVYPEIDIVTTPAGDAVAMVHCNNCTSDLNAWVSLFEEFAVEMGMKIDRNSLFSILYQKALEGDKDGGGMLSYGYLSGEHITHFEEGRPVFVRTPESRFNLANFMRVHLYTALGALRWVWISCLRKESVLTCFWAMEGFLRPGKRGRGSWAAALGVPVSVMETAGEGGAWGAALLASYMLRKEEGESLDHYLAEKVFKDKVGIRMEPDPEDEAGFQAFMERYRKGLSIERAAVDSLK